MCINDIIPPYILLLLLKTKQEDQKLPILKKKVRKNNQRCQICRPFSPQPPTPKKEKQYYYPKISLFFAFKSFLALATEICRLYNSMMTMTIFLCIMRTTDDYDDYDRKEDQYVLYSN